MNRNFKKLKQSNELKIKTISQLIKNDVKIGIIFLEYSKINFICKE